MFRVIYRWHVPTENIAEFQATWCATTDAIHESVQGALGSFMLQSADDPNKVLTIAKWRSRADWIHFWDNSNPEQMHKMRLLAERISVETFDEVADRTHS
ncbi:antibiotic biosynthesis monooxygenase family protein [Pseudoalteromonas rubra]|uniref:Antibiotic biosynthesis monooxygenase n=1 Tax=Pseudoalteromonas rubra TaxID=43658 RepID=A0A5S3X4W8_9GAMM|nr:antibiotic biosynthesis monooxygenase [Pseudoalteromonas rubra]TMP38987.1 antibiotic biosynthesis monooxygenase [Pseudoalteromonas rubra]